MLINLIHPTNNLAPQCKNTVQFNKIFYRNLFQLAIDGPAASGKSSTARIAAQRLKFEYIDSGSNRAMYRVVTLAALRQNLSPVSPEDASKITQLTATSHIHLHTIFNPPTISSSKPLSLPQTLIYLNGEDVTHEIRSPEITKNISGIASNPDVRKLLVEKQRAFANGIYYKDENLSSSKLNAIRKPMKGIVMDGRDVGTVILPNADLKIFVTASAKVRAIRRFKELQQQQSRTKNSSQIVDFNKVLEDLEKRDKSDYERKISPLKKADDAVLLDTSDMSVMEQADKIISLVLERAKEKNIDL
ncbi:Cytidylate kinase-domain-containing protein [Glomus cerebriforme]|uniref:(d)CMP kinase n=1 Tax=Glomus cerebriforme TaxID=658196 RepID=A0A397TM59_9GLOM|nr:Cytidylate kinase-domain-containing protein [Glomus cerebriforme]